MAKRIEIIMRIQVRSIWWVNFDFEENGGNKSFSSKTEASKPCIPLKRTYCAQSQKECRLSWESKFVPFDGWTLILRKITKMKAFLANPSIKTVHPNDKNVFIVHNHCKNRDYRESPSLSHLMDELWFWGKWWKEKLFLENQSIKTMYFNEKNMF